MSKYPWPQRAISYISLASATVQASPTSCGERGRAIEWLFMRNMISAFSMTDRSTDRRLPRPRLLLPFRLERHRRAAARQRRQAPRLFLQILLNPERRFTGGGLPLAVDPVRIE